MFNACRHITDSFRRRIADAAVDVRGSTATMLGFAMIPLLAITGAAVDYSTISRTRTILQESVDAAVLAGAAAVAQGAD